MTYSGETPAKAAQVLRLAVDQMARKKGFDPEWYFNDKEGIGGNCETILKNEEDATFYIEISALGDEAFVRQRSAASAETEFGRATLVKRGTSTQLVIRPAGSVYQWFVMPDGAAKPGAKITDFPLTDDFIADGIQSLVG